MLVNDREWSEKALKLPHQTLQNILHIFCPQTISNKEMLIQCKLECINFVSSSCRGWQWISHVFRRERDSFWRRHLTGHKRVGTSGAGPKIHGNALFWQRWGVWATTGAPSKSWSGQRAVEVLCCCPVCQWAQRPVNDWVCEWIWVYMKSKSFNKEGERKSSKQGLSV